MIKYRFIRALTLTLLIVWGIPNISFAAEIPINANAFILMDAQTGQILLSKNSDEIRPPASTTKIMTALIALEYGSLERQVHVSPKAASTGEASIYLEPGEKITVLDLVKGALIKSGNDATVALAEHISGTEELFVALMNRKAKIIGALRTNFQNPNGLPSKNHYSTAYDLAIMARYGLKLKIFQEIVSTKETKIPWEGRNWDRYLKNTNKLLWTYQGADGVKTGTTREAGNCLVASATKNGRQLIAVVLKSQDRFGEAAKLLNYGFSSTSLQTIVKGTEFGAVYVRQAVKNRVPIVTAVDYSFSAINNKELERKVFIVNKVYRTINKGDFAGYLLIKQKNKELARIPLIAAEGSDPI